MTTVQLHSDPRVTNGVLCRKETIASIGLCMTVMALWRLIPRVRVIKQLRLRGTVLHTSHRHRPFLTLSAKGPDTTPRTFGAKTLPPVVVHLDSLSSSKARLFIFRPFCFLYILLLLHSFEAAVASRLQTQLLVLIIPLPLAPCTAKQIAGAIRTTSDLSETCAFSVSCFCVERSQTYHLRK